LTKKASLFLFTFFVRLANHGFPKVFRRFSGGKLTFSKKRLENLQKLRLKQKKLETKKAKLFLSQAFFVSNVVFVRDYGENLCFVISLSKV